MSFDFVEYAKSRDFGELHTKIDNETGLVAFIAIHNTNLGPALGGCRCIEYPSSNAAILDALRLARGMSYKSAILNLPHGGGKSVLMKPKTIADRNAYFQAFGRFVDELGGRYITAVDSGTGVADMDSISTQTRFVTSTSALNGDTSAYTAKGVELGIKASIKHRLGRDDVAGLHVAIQGVGHVGYLLAKELHAGGAQLTVTDTNTEAMQRCVDEFQAKTVALNEIYTVDCDVFAPCALGSVLNEHTLMVLKAPIIAGCANNQLVNLDFGKQVHARGFTYAPDYVINAGGLIYAAGIYDGESDSAINDKLESISHSLLDIFERSKHDDMPTSDIADQIAQERLG